MLRLLGQVGMSGLDTSPLRAMNPGQTHTPVSTVMTQTRLFGIKTHASDETLSPHVNLAQRRSGQITHSCVLPSSDRLFLVCLSIENPYNPQALLELRMVYRVSKPFEARDFSRGSLAGLSQRGGQATLNTRYVSFA
jgi:hypothetical protein